MSIKSLASTHPSDFFKKYTDSSDVGFKPLEGTKAKFAPTDLFDPVISDIVTELIGARNPVILSNAGGAGEVLSLYSNVATVSKGKPHLVVVDRKDSNMQNIWFRTLLGHTHDNRTECLADLLDVDPKEVEKSGDDIGVLKELIKNKQYNPEAHFDRVMKRASNIQDARLKKIFKQVSGNVASQLSLGQNYPVFAADMVRSLEINPETHYLSNDALFRHSRKILSGPKDGKLSRYNFHCLEADVGTTKGMKSVAHMLDDLKLAKKGVRPIAVSYIPKVESMPDTIAPFLKDKAKMTIASIKTKTGKSWMHIEKDQLPHAVDGSRIAFYDAQAETRKAFTHLADDENLGGLPRTMVLSGLNLGYAYADKRALESHIDIANKTGVDNVIIGGGIYGPHFFTENARRQLNHPDFKLLDEQLKELKKTFGAFNGNVTYVMGPEDEKVAANIYEQYFNIQKTRETGKKTVSRKGILPARGYMNAKNDGVKQLIKETLVPYLIRAGEDPTYFRDEDGEESKLEIILDALSRHKRGVMEKGDENILNMDALEDNDKLKVIFGGTQSYQRPDGNRINTKIYGQVDFSAGTQYVNAGASLDNIARMVANGTLKGGKDDQIIIATGPVEQRLTAGPGDRVVMTVPEMVDDRRYHDEDFLPGMKDVQADPVHKRLTVKKIPNLPGAWTYSGDIRERFYAEPTFPRVLETMDEVQRTGKGLRDFSVLLVPDLQIGSITESLDALVKFWDYSVHERGCKGILGVGDMIQGRNYKEMPNENAMIGACGVGGQQMTLTRLLRPYFSEKQIEFMHAIEGNHESNTDREAQGHHYLHALQMAAEQHLIDCPSHKMDLSFPQFSVPVEDGKEGQIIKAPYGFTELNGYGMLYGHQFSQRGAGKGSGAVPATHLSSWGRQMAEVGRDSDILIGGHYHFWQMNVVDNKLNVICPSFAGISGYELERQYGGSQPMGAIIHFKADGRIGVESVSKEYLENYKVQNPTVKARGVDNYIQDSVNIEASVLGRRAPSKMKKMYRREVVVKP